MPTTWSSTRRSASSSAAGSAMSCSTSRWTISHNPLEIVRLWDGGMSFHGGVIGVSLGILYMAWRHKLDWLRIHDYVACCVPFGLFLGRLANFVNGELWGARDRPALGGASSRGAGGCSARPAAPSEPALRGGARRHPAVPRPLVHVLEDPRPLPARQARRRLHPRLRRSAASWSSSSASRTRISSTSPQRPASTWASGCRCR